MFNSCNAIFMLRNMSYATLWPQTSQHGGCWWFVAHLALKRLHPLRWHRIIQDCSWSTLALFSCITPGKANKVRSYEYKSSSYSFWYITPCCNVSSTTMSAPWNTSPPLLPRCARSLSLSFPAKIGSPNVYQTTATPKCIPDLTGASEKDGVTAQFK